MASNPPFEVEDQTDEDFFDRLVEEDDDDDDKFKVPASSTSHNLADGNESDEVKAFANLSTSEEDDDSTSGDVKALAPSADGHVEESTSTSTITITTSLVSSNPLGFDSLIESDGAALGTSDTTRVDKIDDGSVGLGVKELQWTAFDTHSAQNGIHGIRSYSDFFSKLGDGVADQTGKVVDNFENESNIGSGSEQVTNQNHRKYQETGAYVTTMGQKADGQDLNSSQYWDNQYPGWKFDPHTGQWYQVDVNDASGNVESFDYNSASGWAASSVGNSQLSYLEQPAESSVGNVSISGTTESVTKWNQVSQEIGSAEGDNSRDQISQGNNEYPAHMVFDPRYPGWYFDTVAQEWKALDTYTSSLQSAQANQPHDQLSRNAFASSATFSQNDDKRSYGDYGKEDNFRSQGFDSHTQYYNQAGSLGNYNHQGFDMWHHENVTKGNFSTDFRGNQQLENDYGSNSAANNHLSQPNSYVSRGTVPLDGKATQVHNNFTSTGPQGFGGSANFSRLVEEQMHVANDYNGNGSAVNFSQPQFQSNQFSYAADAGRSSAGRPPHALVTFGFGGKLIVMKESSYLSTASYGSQGSVGGSISVLNLMEVVTEKIGASSMEVGMVDYLTMLCRQSFPGPLVGGSVGSKELNKWIDERIANCESAGMDFGKVDALRLLLSLLKICSQHCGKLRSPFGSDNVLRESDVPESAVARLIASAKRNGAQFGDYGARSHCLQNFPSEGQLQATAVEVQSLLVSGRKIEALHRASEGQLWGPALVLAAQLGNQFYVDTMKQMAVNQLVAGSPLRTLCLLLAGQPADVFSTTPTQYGSNSMLDNWEENLAVITANRTKDDELVLIHLGDSLWKDRSEIIAAHICYLVAEANFEPYSESARLCLIGADHWKFPRTYVSPDAIQRTEFYEYSKVLGNPQFVLLPFQPYKVIYAHMLAEVGKVTESLKYCQVVLKYLKTGRAPEVDTWRKLVTSLEERIRTHQQGGYSTNLDPAKLVGKLFNLIDSTAHRVVGGLPPTVPSASQGGPQASENYYQTMGPRVLTSQSSMAMSSLMPSASMEPINERPADGNTFIVHNKSVSEPDFGRSPRQDHLDTKEATSSSVSKASGISRFGRFSFGSQLLQKTVGLVLKPRQDKQAKLGETNKFYYDEKLKRWIEEGAEPPAEEAAPPPPPTTLAFQNGMSDYNLSTALKSAGPLSNGPLTNGSLDFKSPTPPDHNSGIPPIPTASNQFSARGRTGVRSRYVDTFNKGGGNPTNLFQSPLAPSLKPATSGNPNFFVPSPDTSTEQTFSPTMDSVLETTSTAEKPSMHNANISQAPAPPLSMTMQRFPSMDTISNKEKVVNGNGSLSSYSRRTASWSGSFSEARSPQQSIEVKPLGEVMGLPPSSFMPSEPSSSHFQAKGGGFGDELDEVEL